MHSEHRLRMPFKVRLLRDCGTYQGGAVIDVDEIGDDPKQMMAVRDLVIAGTTDFLDHDDYEIVDED